MLDHVAIPRSTDSPLISTHDLAEILGMPGVVVVDASWYLPAMNRNAKAEYLAGHIPGAVFFDIDEISDHRSSLPHMLPDPVSFSSAMRKLGIGDGMRVVVYDGAGLFSAARVWWTLRAFGLADVKVLDGGMPQWSREGRPVEEGETTRQTRHFTARLDHSVVAGVDEVRAALESGAIQVVDARPAPRWRGEADEPRPGVRRGRMPGSLNLPFTDVVANGALRTAPELVAAFEKAGIDWRKPIITSCGSGVSAAVLTLALAEAGKRTGALYDGSWAEWGSRTDLPVATG